MFCIICKKYKYPIFLLCKNLYCVNHSKLLFNHFIVLIQKLYRAYKVRRILNKIYFKLPRDLQIHILSFNSIKTIQNTQKNHSKIINTIALATHKINDVHNLSENKITLAEINENLKVLKK